MSLIKVINNATDGTSLDVKWFTEYVLNRWNIKYDECIIEDFDLDRVYLNIDGWDYTIRTWNIYEDDYDETKARVDYTLFKTKKLKNGLPDCCSESIGDECYIKFKLIDEEMEY